MAFGPSEPVAASSMARSLEARAVRASPAPLHATPLEVSSQPLASSRALTLCNAGLLGVQPAVQERTEHPLGGLLGAQPACFMQAPMESLLGHLQGSTEQGGVAHEASTTLASSTSEVRSWAHMATPALRQRLGVLRTADLAVAVRRRPTIAEWRDTPALHEHWWACLQCQLVVPISSQACGPYSVER